jgi:TFIIH basal transcription factor complex TTD-A subunit
MGPKKKSDKKSSSSPTAKASSGNSPKKQKDLPPCAGYLISCDVPTKQYIQYLNELKPVDKKFILEDLDSTHLLVKKKAREEIERKVEAWMDEVRLWIGFQFLFDVLSLRSNERCSSPCFAECLLSGGTSRRKP